MRFRSLLSGASRRARAGLERLADHPDLPLVLDEAWYLARYPDVLNSGLGAAQHFLASGVLEGRSPSPYVDLRFTAESLPHGRRDGRSVLFHLLEGGITAGTPTSPFVDLPWFGRRHGLVDADPRELLSTLVRYGRVDRLDPSPWLDLTWYGETHAEITNGGLDPFEYFLAVGRWLGRFPHPCWDEDRYLALNDYVRTAVGSGKYASGFEHFCAAGYAEAEREAIALPLRIAGRADEFSESRYRDADPDIGMARSGLEHLMTGGHRAIAAGQRRLKCPSPLSDATLRPTALAPSGDLLVLLNHFDIDQVVDEHVRIAIATYRDAGADVVLITTSGEAQFVREVDGMVTDIVAKSRNDDLRDFGGWHHAIQLLGPERLARYRRVVLANDSTYFPVCDPATFLTRLRTSEADIFAATDSVSGGRYHLQSYFLALGPHAQDVLIPEMGRRVAEQAEATKMSLIQRFEVGLSEYAHAQGLTSEVFFPLASIPDLAAALSPPEHRPISRLAATVLNLTHHFWRAGLTAGLPFLKVELLRDNPVRVDIEGWQGAIGGENCTSALIEAHLTRVQRTPAHPPRDEARP